MNIFVKTVQRNSKKFDLSRKRMNQLSVPIVEVCTLTVPFQSVSRKGMVIPTLFQPPEAAEAAAEGTVHTADIKTMTSKQPDLQGKITLISGGSSGIGFALAKLMAKNGASLIILARDEEKLAKAKAEIEAVCVSPDQTVRTLSVDMRSAAEVSEKLPPLLKEAGIPDYTVHSAGVVYPALFEKIDDERFHWMMDTNYFGAVNLFRVIVPTLKERKSGHIVAMGSAASFIGIWGYTAYSGSKYAIRGLCDVLRSELKPHNIHVSIVFPPDTDTPQLAYENQFKSPVTKEVSGTIKPLSPDFVASKIYEGIMKNKYIIMPDRSTRLLFTACSLLGPGINKVLDFYTNRAVKKYGADF